MLYNNLKETFDEIRFQEEKKAKLEKLLSVSKYNNIQIHFIADKQLQTIYQSDCPYNLENEIKLLLNDMINEINLHIHSLKTQL